MIDLIIDSEPQPYAAYELLDAIGVNVEKHNSDINVLRVDGLDATLVEEVLTEHGIEFQWDNGEDE